MIFFCLFFVVAKPNFELSGNEDQSILHGFISYLPSGLAYKQIKKFKKRSRFLEFLVLVAMKGLTDTSSATVLEWCQEADEMFTRSGHRHPQYSNLFI